MSKRVGQAGTFFFKAKTKESKRGKRLAKDGRTIGPRDPRSSQRGRRNQLWTEDQMAEAFRLRDLYPDMKYREIQRRTTVNGVEIPYTTLNDRLAGRRGQGTGHCAGGKRTPRVLTQGKSKQGVQTGTSG